MGLKKIIEKTTKVNSNEEMIRIKNGLKEFHYGNCSLAVTNLGKKYSFNMTKNTAMLNKKELIELGTELLDMANQ